MRITGESLSFSPDSSDSDEINSDRMLGDPIKQMQASAGGINFELSYPVDNSPLSEVIRSAMYNPWVNSNVRDNDGTADSVITAMTGTTDVATVTTGTAFVAGQLAKFTGFTSAANNGVFKCTTGSATVPVFLGAGFVTEAAPAAAARIKVVGFQGAAADITTHVTNGLVSTLLDFTTLGLAVGQWIKIGGTAAGDKFATAAVNDWVRISGTITATNIPLDNLPVGWATDAGTGKTIKVWAGDQIKNGITPSPVSIERGFLGQTVPTYIVNNGMHAGNLTLNVASKAKITGSVAFTGMGGGESTTSLDASPDAITTGLVMAANANVGRLGVNGSQLIGPNWAKDISFVLENNLRTVESVDSASPVAVREGECKVTGKMSTYFGNDTELAAFYAGTTRPINARVAKTSQALIFQIPRATYRGGGNPNATAKNTDVMISFDYQASRDTTTNAHYIIDRVEYFEV